jgi:hypothetical protein
MLTSRYALVNLALTFGEAAIAWLCVLLINSSSHHIPLRYFYYVGVGPASLMLLLLPLIWLVSKEMGQNLTKEEKLQQKKEVDAKITRGKEQMVRSTKPPFSPVVTEQPLPAEPESPTSPLHRNAPTGLEPPADKKTLCKDEPAPASPIDPEAPPLGPPDAADAKSGCVIN